MRVITVQDDNSHSLAIWLGKQVFAVFAWRLEVSGHLTPAITPCAWIFLIADDKGALVHTFTVAAGTLNRVHEQMLKRVFFDLLWFWKWWQATG